MDVLGAGVGLLVLSPVLAIAALFVLVLDGRPVLFVQDRAGPDGKPFRIVKFRTMRIGADAERAMLRAQNEVAGGASFKLTNDPRITRTRSLAPTDQHRRAAAAVERPRRRHEPRRTPPAPLRRRCGIQLTGTSARLSVKPGLTGLWQISARSNPDFDTWVNLDLEYIDSWSLALDLRIIAGTIPALIRSDGR